MASSTCASVPDMPDITTYFKERYTSPLWYLQICRIYSCSMHFFFFITACFSLLYPSSVAYGYIWKVHELFLTWYGNSHSCTVGSTFASVVSSTMVSHLMLNLHETADAGIYSVSRMSQNPPEPISFRHPTIEIAAYSQMEIRPAQS
ncbi:hypothetical protein H2248_002733 [Termitomyces sp. 'cryptogamus']|nr:hypothetical protein H2248_002733 [Termitomyces sp. 'cryptogamus']